MPRFLVLLMLDLLLSHEKVGGGRRPSLTRKPLKDRTPSTQVKWLRRKLDFIGCYGAVFSLEEIASVDAKDNCEEACSPTFNKWHQSFRDLRRNYKNLCLANQFSYSVKTGHESLGVIDSSDCQNKLQCKCTFNITLTDILLSSPASINNQKWKGKGPNPFGSETTPSNCNASTYGPWLAHKFDAKEGQMKILDEVVDPVCEAFIQLVGPLEPRAETEEAYAAALASAAAYQQKLRKRKKDAEALIPLPDPSKRQHTSSGRCSVQQQRTNLGSCSVQRPVIPDLNLPAPESLCEEETASENPTEEENTAQRLLLMDQAQTAADGWNSYFPLDEVMQQDDDKDDDQ